MKTTVKPYGMLGAVENEASFDPSKPVKPCYWGVDGFGFALGFTQMIQAPDDGRQVKSRWFGGMFVPRMSPARWKHGNIDFDHPATLRQFAHAFERAYGVQPVIEMTAGGTAQSADEWIEFYQAREHRVPVAV